MDRREFIGTAGLSVAAISVASNIASAGAKVKIGICDWNLRGPNGEGGTCRPDLFGYAKKADLEGVQVSVAKSPTEVPLRDPKIRDAYKKAIDETGVQVCSVAAGSILNSIPLASEPQSAVYVIEALEAAKALDAQCTLLAFFGNGDLRAKDAQGNIRNISKGKFRVYELDTQGVTRVVEVLRQIAPRAEALGVAIGLENTITAEQNLEIIERVGSPIVQVYYDIANSTSNGYDVPGEIRMLGSDRICEIHLKDNGKDQTYFEGPNPGVDWANIAQAIKDIKFDKWFVIEESGRKDMFLEDTKSSVAFARRVLT